jgi:Flp pilus assembly protein TadD
MHLNLPIHRASHISLLRYVDARRACILLLLPALSIAAHAQLPAGTRSANSTTEVTPLSQAEDAIAAQRFDAAKKFLLSINLKDARTLYDLGFVDEALHDKAAAEADYRAAIAADPKNFEAHAALGMLLIDTDRAACIAELETAVTLTPAANPAAAKAGVLRTLAHLHADHEPAKAGDELLAAIQLTSETKEDTELTGYIAAMLGDTTDAEAAYRRILAKEPGDPETVYALSAILIAKQKLDEAQAMLSSAYAAHPEFYPLAAQLARVYMLQGADEKAVPLLEAQHAQHPKDAAVTRMLADLYNSTGNAAQADALYQVLLASKPNDIDLLSARGDSLIRQKNFAEAEAVLQRAASLFLSNPAALPATDDRVQLFGSLAFAASENGQPAVVLTALDQRLHYAVETPATLFLRATAHDHLHHVPLARSFYTQFLATAQGKYPDEEWEAKHRLIALATEK